LPFSPWHFKKGNLVKAIERSASAMASDPKKLAALIKKAETRKIADPQPAKDLLKRATAVRALTNAKEAVRYFESE